MILKQVIKYNNANAIEATWVDAEDKVIRCQSYADVQMQMFRDHVAQFGGDIADYEALIAEVESNIQPPENGPSHAELVAETLDLARKERQPIISVLDGLQASSLTKGDMATAQTIEGVKQQLRDITKIDLSACTTGDEMRLAVLGAYAGIVSANPSLKLAFKEVTA